jgi:secondary thiamine-phosphate synthase enzyme
MANLIQASHMLRVPTRGQGFIDITYALARWLDSIPAGEGLLTAFICHTSASLTVQENADPNVRVDLLAALEAFAPADRAYTHAEEGPDDMPSHIKSMLTSVNLSIPVQDGRMTLGTWQGVFLIEHRTEPHERTVALHFIGHRAPIRS